jgi:hypothetical protein
MTTAAITLKSLGKGFKLVYLDGVKIGVISKERFTSTGFHSTTYTSWTGELTHNGRAVHLGSTAKLTDVGPKVLRLLGV